jgi:hypothetical protein
MQLLKTQIYAPLYESDNDIDGDADPKTFDDAWNHPSMTERQGWREAIPKELKDMNTRNVWKNKRLIGRKWIFKKKKVRR